MVERVCIFFALAPYTWRDFAITACKVRKIRFDSAGRITRDRDNIVS
jgi:hypothetical protein